ncbi:MAG: flagellar export protein FliJ [Dehalococcoidia bacterium]
MAKFRLQTVLDLKQRLEDAQQRELGMLTQQRLRAEEALQYLAAQEREQEEALASRVHGGRLHIDEVRSAMSYIDGVRASIVAQRDRAAELEARIRDSRTRLTEIARERNVLERLRERHTESEAVESGRRDQRAADELTSQRYARQAWEV